MSENAAPEDPRDARDPRTGGEPGRTEPSAAHGLAEDFDIDLGDSDPKA